MKSREETLINAKNLCNNRNNVIMALKTEFLPLKIDFKKTSQIYLMKHYQIG